MDGGLPGLDGDCRAGLHCGLGNLRLRVRLDARRDRGPSLDLCARRRGARPAQGRAAHLRRHGLARQQAGALACACWLVFTVLTGLSLWCAYGTTATQLAEKFADQAVASTTQATKQGKLDRLLEDKRKQLPYTVTSAEARGGSQEDVRDGNQPAQDGVRRSNEKRGQLQGSARRTSATPTRRQPRRQPTERPPSRQRSSPPTSRRPRRTWKRST